MAEDRKPEATKTQQTHPKKGEPIEIPVPKREDFDRFIRATVKDKRPEK
jgi:hypothetical protein